MVVNKKVSFNFTAIVSFMLGLTLHTIIYGLKDSVFVLKKSLHCMCSNFVDLIFTENKSDLC